MRYEIRKARPEDRDALAEIRVAAMRPSLEDAGRYDPVEVKQRLIRSFVPDETVVFEKDGTILGFYVLNDEGDHLYLNHIYVDPTFQGEGIGSEMLGHAIELSNKRAIPIRLQALKGSPANQFNKTNGFVETGEELYNIHYERPPDDIG